MSKTLPMPMLLVILALGYASPGHAIMAAKKLEVPDLKENVIYRGKQVAESGSTWKSVVRIGNDIGGCSATFLESDMLVTAAHCLVNDKGRISPLTFLSVTYYHGSAAVSTRHFMSGRESSEDAFLYYVHPQYDRTDSSILAASHDIAVIVFSEGVLPDTHSPASVLSSREKGGLEIGKPAIVVGAGRIGVKQADEPYDLRFANVQFSGFGPSYLMLEPRDPVETARGADSWETSRWDRGGSNRFDRGGSNWDRRDTGWESNSRSRYFATPRRYNPRNWSFNDRNATGVCHGDSGGPVMIPSAGGYVVAGVSSRMFQSESTTNECGTSMYYTMITADHYDWMMKNYEKGIQYFANKKLAEAKAREKEAAAAEAEEARLAAEQAAKEKAAAKNEPAASPNP